MRMYRKLFAYGLFFFSLNFCYAGCPDTLQGQSANYQVTISDNACSYDEEMIQVWKFKFNELGEDDGLGEKPDILILSQRNAKLPKQDFLAAVAERHHLPVQHIDELRTRTHSAQAKNLGYG